MKTRIYTHPTAQELESLGEQLRQGALVAIPTETVYGLGANGLDAEAMARIYAAKGRPSDNPLILHVPDSEAVRLLVKNISPIAQTLMDTFWPGPLTITMPKSDIVPDKATGGLPNVALRCPDHTLCREFLRAAGVPVAAPSANISGRPSPTRAEDVYHDMNGKIEAIIDAGPCTIGVESTVVECNEDGVTILRPGGITEEMLAKVVGTVRYDAALVGANTIPKAPGMKYKHYAPDAAMTTYVGNVDAVVQAIVDQLKTIALSTSTTDKTKVGLLISEQCWQQMKSQVATMDFAVKAITYDSKEPAQSLAKELYSSLLRFNEWNADVIIAEGVSPAGLGTAVMNRMDKASAHRVIRV